MPVCRELGETDTDSVPAVWLTLKFDGDTFVAGNGNFKFFGCAAKSHLALALPAESLIRIR